MTSNDKKLLTEFRDSIELYNRLDAKAFKAIEEIIRDNDFFVMYVTHRVKDYKSLEYKLKKKSGKYISLQDITDLCGVRVICFFSDTVDLIAKKLEESFDIDHDNSIDKRASLEANQFGYLSLHYICSFSDAGDLSGIPFEVQIRTALQHTWDEIEHDLGYKSMFGVPRSIRRDFSRIAGLLELADKEFIEVRDNIRSYNDEVHNKIIKGDTDDVLLDFVSLSEFVKNNTFFRSVEDELIGRTSVEIEYIEPDSYIAQLEWLHVKTISDLLNLMMQNRDLSVRIIVDQIKEYELDIISTNMILRYFCRSVLINGDYSEEKIRDFISLALEDASSVDYQTTKFMDIKKRYKD